MTVIDGEAKITRRPIKEADKMIQGWTYDEQGNMCRIVGDKPRT